MKKVIFSGCAALLLAACGTSEKIALEAKPPKAQTKSRSEPIFYNGKTYQLDFSHTAGVFDMRVSGMGPKQQKDAVAVATSALRYFACPDGQNGQMIGTAKFAGTVWKLRAKCV